MRPSAWRRLPLIRRLASVRSRAAIGAALAAVLVFGGGGFWIRDTIRDDWLTQTMVHAHLTATKMAGDLNAGRTDYGNSVLIDSYALILDDGRWLAHQGEFLGYENQDAPIARGSRPSILLLPGRAGDDRYPFETTISFPERGESALNPPSRPGPDVRGRTLPAIRTITDVLPSTQLTEIAGGHVVPAQRVTVYVVASPLNADVAADAVDQVMWNFAPLAVLLVAIVAAWSVGRALRPVEAIRTRLAEITAHALDQRVPVPHSGDVITKLATTTNATLERLQRAVERQREFVADASHELRSPLASLRSALEVTLTYGREADWRASLAAAVRETERIQVLAEDLLVLARLDAAAPARATGVALTDVAAVVEEQIAERQFTHEGTGAPRFTARIAGPALVAVDEPAIARVVRNLLDNAAQYARSSVVAAVTVDDDVTLTVDDDGPGIAPEDRQRIFERFVRLDDARTRASGGAGLGLAIVAGLVGSAGGSVGVADSPAGARLVVRLPRVTDDGAGRSTVDRPALSGRA